jgi:hypothetical protein
MAEDKKVEAAPLTEPPKSGKSVVATVWPTGNLIVDDKITVTKEGVELSAADAKKAFAAAESAGVKLVVLKEVSE